MNTHALAAGELVPLGLAAVAGAALAGVLTHPGRLDCFKLAAGGPARGPRVAIDSKLDWGRDLYRLPGALAALGHRDRDDDWMNVLHSLADFAREGVVPVEGVRAEREEDAARMLGGLRRGPPELVVVNDRNVAQYGSRGFGIDCAQDSASWIEQGHQLERVFPLLRSGPGASFSGDAADPSYHSIPQTRPRSGASCTIPPGGAAG